MSTEWSLIFAIVIIIISNLFAFFTQRRRSSDASVQSGQTPLATNNKEKETKEKR